jgi:transmembrane sensor
MSTDYDTGLPAGEPLERSLRPALDEAAVARVWRGIRAHRASEQGASARGGAGRRARWAFAGASSLVAVAAVVALVRMSWGAPETPGALHVVAQRGALSTVLRPSPSPIALDDGSQLVLSATTNLEVLANDGARFVTLLRRGRCHFSVKPGGPRRWTIETDLATVEVVGTEFTVDRGERGLEVSVDHGIVLVRGERVPGRVTRLRAHERLVVPVVEPRAATPAAAPSIPPAPDSVASRARELTLSRRDVAATPPQPMRVRAPLEAVSASGAETDAADARLAEADAARAAGRNDEAAGLFAEVMRESANDSRGALAAFSLAKLQLDELGRPAEAAETFAWVVRRGSPRALVEDAQARRVEALARAGRRSEAAAEARVYEARWPEGRRLAEVRALVAE